jgi:hypothetical protein
VVWKFGKLASPTSLSFVSRLALPHKGERASGETIEATLMTLVPKELRELVIGAGDIIERCFGSATTDGSALKGRGRGSSAMMLLLACVESPTLLSAKIEHQQF